MVLATGRVVEQCAPYEAIRSFCNRVRAGLAAHPNLASQAGAWESAADDTLAVHVAAMKGDDDIEAAWVVERLAVRAWDIALQDLSTQSSSLAGDPARSLHGVLFGAIGVADAARLGPGKAALLGHELVALGRRRASGDPNHEGLTQALDRLEAATNRVVEAEGACEREGDQRFGFELAKAHLVRRINRLVDATAVFILRTEVGRADLVDAIVGERA